MTQRDIKPCPFCGSEAKIRDFCTDPEFNIYRCSNNKCAASTIQATEAEWNSRAPQTQGAKK
jgi:hypothetical protein